MVPANFNQLYYFWVIGKTGSISAAAKLLLLNQSTLSVQLKQLETALGRRLLTRGRRGVSPTEAGSLALECCEGMFGRAEEMLAALRGSAPLAAVKFRLGASESISHRKILEVIRFIKGGHPGISVRIFSGSAEELLARVERHDLDMALCDGDLSVRGGGDFRSKLVSSAQLYFVAVPELKKKMGRFPSGLVRVPLLLRAPDNPVRKDVEYFLHRRGIAPDVRSEVENSDLIRLMMLDGEGAAIMDPRQIEAELSAGRLVRLHAKSVGIRENIWLLCRRRDAERAVAREIIDDVWGRFAFKAGEA